MSGVGFHIRKKKKKNDLGTELALKSIPHPGIFGGFGRNVFFFCSTGISLRNQKF